MAEGMRDPRSGGGWLRIGATVPAERAEAVTAALEAAGAEAVSVEVPEAGDAVLEPPPAAVVLPSEVRVVGLFPGEADAASLCAGIARTAGLPPQEVDAEPLPDRDWTRVWLDRFGPMRFGERLWVCPTGAEAPPPPAVTVRLDPGLAFGTGTHPSTALCLEWLDGAPLEGCRVVDYGCGSGILGIAAALLGAAEVLAVDIDPQALTATVENARRNGVEGRVRALAPEGLPGTGSADVVLANILARPLMELAPRLTALLAPGGRLVLAGILAAQAPAVAAAYPQVRFDPPRTRDGWARLAGRRI